MSYLIFGGSGFIGTHLVNLLHEQYPAATIYNLDIVENNHDGKSVFVHCDVRQPIELDVPLSEDDVIFNFSAVHRTPGHPDCDYFETNIRGAEHVTEFAERYNIKSIVFTSSIAPYGASEDLKEETTLTMPNTPYGISKLVAEKIHGIWQAKGQQERQLTIVRPGVVFGVGENGNFTRLYWGIRSGRFVYPGRKDTIKGCIYVKDLVRFMLYRLEHHQEGVELYNCTYEPAFTIEQICDAMMRVTGIRRILLKIPGGLLMGVATIAGVLGGRVLGIHPARVKKLMVSTNISGKKLAASGYKFHYTFEEALEDWFNDNEGRGLR
jgi:nucleoside-diphosphate-sugar epimerase